MSGGIYRIRHAASGKVYIGSAINFANRFSKHRADLRAGSHHCIYLQRAWHKYGGDAFVFEIVQSVTDPAWLLFNEQAYIDSFGRNDLIYNVCRTAGNCAGVKHSAETKEKRAAKLRGRPRSEATKRLLSDMAKARGLPKSFAAMMRHADARRFRLTPEQAERAAQMHANGVTWKTIARDEFNIHLKGFRRAMREAGFDPRKFGNVKNTRNHARGARHGCAKLSEDDARYIIASNAPLKALAAKFGIDFRHVCDIRNGRSWGHLHAEIRNGAAAGNPAGPVEGAGQAVPK